MIVPPTLLTTLLFACLCLGYLTRLVQECVQGWWRRRNSRLILERAPFVEPRRAGRGLVWNEPGNN
jgi:hypothetical protein